MSHNYAVEFKPLKDLIPPYNLHIDAVLKHVTPSGIRLVATLDRLMNPAPRNPRR